MKVQVYTVDAFTDKAFSGNPAAVVPLMQPLGEETLQQVAAELNLSETAYVVPIPLEVTDTADLWHTHGRFSLRWFTPTNEVPLCGHATLATAYVLFHCLGNKKEQLEFETLSGVLVARQEGSHIVLDFPSNPPRPLTQEEEVALTSLVKAAAGDLKVEQVQLSPTTKKLLVRLNNSCTRQQLEAVRPDPSSLLTLHNGSMVKGVILTLKGELTGKDKGPPGYHCFSRYFAPWFGIPEDPVTGSAHTVLGPYWSQELHTTTLSCRQVSHRGGDVVVRVRGDGRVDLSGLAINVLQGWLHL
ncbi:hypothetical protein Pcinc_004909 [Petrolisthes cinctipes]|uniref:Phenazine biosynthesis-like protein n=1 Tax=Petrolisthes cinctipes TaxID=88211 RepID=A0AAE1GDV1_PETCI|nr:hypothetical protein Pcinc_004909 [Petrolisthes cinctipes]